MQTKHDADCTVVFAHQFKSIDYERWEKEMYSESRRLATCDRLAAPTPFVSVAALTRAKAEISEHRRVK